MRIRTRNVLSFFALSILSLARLPGPKIPFLSKFKCSEDRRYSDAVRISASLVTGLSWLSTSVTGIILRRVWWDEDNGWSYNEAPIWSEVEVKFIPPSTFRLRGLNDELKNRLLSAKDSYSIAVVQGPDRNFHEEIFVVGEGGGVWEIQR